MVILGIDPGTATTGYGVIKINGNNTLEIIEYGLVETSKGTALPVRLMDIHAKFIEIFARIRPNVVAIERLFFATNAKTAISVGQAQGVMFLSAASAGVPIYEYSPMTIKKVVAGSGRADKIQVQKSVRRFLGAGVRKKKGEKTHFDNAADALAVALCHIKIEGGELG